MHKHIYSLLVTVERFMPELGTPKAYFKCACGSKLSSEEGLAIINAAEQVSPVTAARVCEHGYKMSCPHGCL